MPPQPTLTNLSNLWAVYNQAGDLDRKIALQSYQKYHDLCRDIGKQHRFPVEIAAAVFAALSPNNDYYGNLRDAANLLANARAKNHLADFNVSTYGQNKRKAWYIAMGFIRPLDAIRAKKTRNFYLNIVDPTDPMPVTIDGHMINMWRGERVNLVGLRSSPALYEEIAGAVRYMGTLVGLIPNQVQAILWQTHRRLLGIQSDPQFEFWDREYHAAKVDSFKKSNSHPIRKRINRTPSTNGHAQALRTKVGLHNTSSDWDTQLGMAGDGLFLRPYREGDGVQNQG